MKAAGAGRIPADSVAGPGLADRPQPAGNATSVHPPLRQVSPPTARALGRAGARGRSQPRTALLRACGPASGHVTAAQVSTASGVGSLLRRRLRLPVHRVHGRG